MSRGRSKFGNHNRPDASVVERRKKADKTMKSAVSTAVAVTVAVSHEVSRQSKKAAKKGGATRPVSPEYAAAVRLAQEQAEAEAVAMAAVQKVRRPVTPGLVRLISAFFILVGLIATLVFWPVGLGIVAIAVYCIVCAGKIADQQNERAGLSAADQDGGVDL